MLKLWECCFLFVFFFVQIEKGMLYEYANLHDMVYVATCHACPLGMLYTHKSRIMTMNIYGSMKLIQRLYHGYSNQL